eukprot:749884-Hanusia_phi.AAC.2
MAKSFNGFNPSIYRPSDLLAVCFLVVSVLGNLVFASYAPPHDFLPDGSKDLKHKLHNENKIRGV